MDFSALGIIKFKKRYGNYISYRKNLKPSQLKQYFYEHWKKLDEMYPGKDIKYCYFPENSIVVGDFQVGLRYKYDDNTYYLFIAANSYGAPAQDFAIGKVVDGTIYLIRENSFIKYITFMEIDEKQINKEKYQSINTKYFNDVMLLGPAEDIIKHITDRDINCLKIAYEGSKAFDKLIIESPFF